MPKYLDEFIEGRIYVETNIFLFAALADAKYGPSALRFLERSCGDELELFTSTLTVDEVSFVALKAKLEEKYGVMRNQVLYLKRNPEVVKALASDVNQIVENVLSLTTLTRLVLDSNEYILCRNPVAQAGGVQEWRKFVV